MIEATERSISRAMIKSAIGSAMIAFSVKLKVASERFQGSRKYGRELGVEEEHQRHEGKQQDLPAQQPLASPTGSRSGIAPRPDA